MDVDRPAGDDLPFRQLAEHLPTPCWISDVDGRIIWVNAAWIAYTGMDVATLDREGLAAIHDPKVLPSVRRKWAETKAAGVADEMVFPLRGRDGVFRPFHTRVVPLRRGGGVIWRWFGTNTDISREAEVEARAARTEITLHENEARLRLATEAAGVGVWEWRLDTNEMVYSPQAKAICGFDPDAAVTYEMVAAVTHPDDFPRTSAQAARALDPNVREAAPYEYRIIRPSGELRWVSAVGETVFAPDEKGDLSAVRYVGVLIDITDRKLADDAIRESERQLQMALRSGRMAAWRVDAAGRLVPNPELNLLAGLPPDARPTLEQFTANYLPGDVDRISAAAERARSRGERYFEIEYGYRLPDGEVRFFYGRAEAQVSPSGEPAGVSGVVMDITERKANEQRLHFLTREVDHRANNLMAVVAGIVSLSRADTVEELREVVRGRIQALARTHQLLAETRWAGAELRSLVDDELAPFGLGDSGARVHVAGPDVRLEPATAQAVAMVLHELATNAVKHGALSLPDGRIELCWTVQPDAPVQMTWAETGGPPVRPPTRQGLGTLVIQRAFYGAALGEVQLDWRPEGLVCVLRLDGAVSGGRDAASA